MITDRHRVELMLPAQMMLAVLIAGADAPNHPDAKEARACLKQASDEVVADLSDKQRASLARRVARVHLEITEEHRRIAARVDKVGLIAYYLIKAITDCDYLVIPDGSAMSRGLAYMLRALEPSANIERLDQSAQKASRKMLLHLQRLGYYERVPVGDMLHDDLEPVSNSPDFVEPVTFEHNRRATPL